MFWREDIWWNIICICVCWLCSLYVSYEVQRVNVNQSSVNKCRIKIRIAEKINNCSYDKFYAYTYIYNLYIQKHLNTQLNLKGFSLLSRIIMVVEISDTIFSAWKVTFRNLDLSPSSSGIEKVEKRTLPNPRTTD